MLFFNFHISYCEIDFPEMAFTNNYVFSCYACMCICCSPSNRRYTTVHLKKKDACVSQSWFWVLLISTPIGNSSMECYVSYCIHE